MLLSLRVVNKMLTFLRHFRFLVVFFSRSFTGRHILGFFYVSEVLLHVPGVIFRLGTI